MYIYTSNLRVSGLTSMYNVRLCITRMAVGPTIASKLGLGFGLGFEVWVGFKFNIIL